MHRVSWGVIWGFLLVGSACAHSRGAAANDDTARLTEVVTRVHVVNRYKDGLEIFASGTGSVQRLGLVAAGAEKDFVIPQAMVVNGSLSFLAQPTAYGPIVRSEQVRISPEAVVDFDITTSLIGSQANVRP
jgi:hypothetical protein